MFAKRYQKLTPYTPGEQPRNRKYIKLNTNENPYPPSPSVAEFLHSMDITQLRLYPDPSSLRLREMIGEYNQVSPDNIFIGNGSDEVLSFCFYSFFDSNEGPLLFPEHTYSFYPVYCSYYDISFKRIPLQNDFSISFDSFLREKEYTGIIFPNPNAPTGILSSIEEINRLMDSVPKDRIVIVDEAYIDFGGISAVSLTEEYSNLLIVQTLSKSRSLAGARIGIAIGEQKLIKALNTVKDSFNSYPLDYISQRIGEIAISDQEYFQSTISKIIATREYTVRTLLKLGWEVLPSKANFIFIRNKKKSGIEIYTYLRNQGILVRHFNHPGIENFLRVSIGKEKDMELLTELLQFQ